MYFTGISDEAGASIARQIAAHQALGWQQHELRNINGRNLTDVDDETFEQVVAALSDAGMTVCCLPRNWRTGAGPSTPISPSMSRSCGTPFRACTVWARAISAVCPIPMTVARRTPGATRWCAACASWRGGGRCRGGAVA